LAVGLFFLIRSIPKQKSIHLAWPKDQKKETVSPPETQTTAPNVSGSQPVAWSEEQAAVLNVRVKVTMPRALSEDEMHILTRRVDFAIDMHQLPVLHFMSEDEFDKALNRAQQEKKIYFPGKYKRELKDLFTNHYLAAQTAYEAGRVEETRDELLNSIVFPIFRNDLLLHRSVAQVMLRPYINDVLAKMQALNAYVLRQNLAQAMEGLEKGYQDLFALIESNDWDKAYALAKGLTDETNSIEAKKNQFQVPYPAVVGEVDQDIRKGLEWQDESLAPISTSLNSVLADLRIKTKTLETNTTEALKKAAENYEKATMAIDEKRWPDAIKWLEQVIYPIELVQDAQAKLAVLHSSDQTR